MSMTFTKEMQPKLAILNLVLDELGVEPAIETLDDRKRVQKAIYLAQRAGVDLGYRHGWYKKGPYSPGLTRDYYKLAEALDIGESASDLKLAPPEAVAKLRSIKPMFKVPSGVNLQDEEWLELLASLDFLGKISQLSEADVCAVMKKKKPRLHEYLDCGMETLRQYKISIT